MIKFEWDEEKNRINRIKHGWDFRNAARVFADPFSIEDEDRSVDYGESRYKITGYAENTLATVICAVRSGVFRLMPARAPSSQERKDHEGNIGGSGQTWPGRNRLGTHRCHDR
jgi:uncharacterized DUF497 family protein